MLFNSLDFAIFLPTVFIFYWFVFEKNLKYQNALIVVASYIFYSWWDWRFLSLIIFSTLVDFYVGKKLKKEIQQSNRILLLSLSIIVNLGFLGFFKYYNFFLENFVDAFSLFGTNINGNSLNIILPVGISFYTFQTLSYTIDVYKKKLEPTEDFIAFSAFVSFFPQLVAGPIERATNLLPQINKFRVFDEKKAVDGLKQILFGLFKKLVIADNCAVYVDQIFSNYQVYEPVTLIIGIILFSFQIYCDFSGYSDMAIGIARLFGFNLMQNFRFPYFSRDIAEFWRNWHISLSTWFRDYLYIPLGGSRVNSYIKIRNILIVFIVSGFWHGANWTFIAWGSLNALFILPLILFKLNRQYIGFRNYSFSKILIYDLLKIGFTFMLINITWVFFRAENINIAINYIIKMFDFSNYSIPIEDLKVISIGSEILILFVIIFMFLLLEWRSRFQNHVLEKNFFKSKFGNHIFYYFLIILMLVIDYGNSDFIYFQF